MPKRSLARRVQAAARGVLMIHTIKSTDARRARIASARRLWHGHDWRTRRTLALESHPPSDVAIPQDAGYAVFSSGRFEEASEIARLAQDRIRAVKPDALEWERPQVRWGLLDAAALTLDSPYLRLSLRAEIISAVSDYLGAVPVLWSVDVWYSRPVARAPGDSQLFHCDWDAPSQVKLFVHCSDVDDTNGPLVLIDARTSERVREQLRYSYGAADGRVSDEAMNAVAGTNGRASIVGPAGTVALLDTSRCFHYGSRVAEGAAPRIVAMFQYLTPAAFALPLNYRKRAPLRGLTSPSLSKIQRLVLGAE
jgi:hypothetical protein